MRARWMAIVGLAAAVSYSTALGETPAAQLEKGVFQQETAGDLDAAVKVYKQIVDEANSNRRFVAEAQYRIGECYQKQGKKAEAEAAFRQVIASYPDQAELVAKARKEVGEAEPINAQAESLEATEFIFRAARSPSRSSPLLEAALKRTVNLFGPVYP
jgi:tetratricopeptide (TPR) repeat protein